MESIEDILFDGLIHSNNVTYDIELYLNTIFAKYITYIRLLQYSPLNKIREYIELYNNIVIFHKFYFKNRIYPINYLFMNIHLSEEVIDFALNNNMELSYYNEDRLITYYLLNNKLDEEGKINILKHLKLKDYDFFAKDSNKNNILHYLANYKSDDNEIYELILSYCSDINELNINSSSPLLLAMHNNNINYINILLSNNCDVNLPNSNNNTPLMYACMYNNYEIITKLIDIGADINAKDNQLDSAFLYACGCDNKGILNLDIIKYLHKNNCEINNMSIEKYNALHYASGCTSLKSNIDIIKYLIDIGVKIDLMDKDNNTFLDYLIKYGDDNDKIYNLLNTMSLSTDLKNTLIIKDYIDLNKLNLFKHNADKIDCSICYICHDTPENKIIKCVNNHYFDYECILNWFVESNSNKCPLCFNDVDLTDIYFVN
jgi:hypothetical protein